MQNCDENVMLIAKNIYFASNKIFEYLKRRKKTTKLQS